MVWFRNRVWMQCSTCILLDPLLVLSNKCNRRARCGPRLTEEAAEKLKNRYVLMRNSSREVEEEGEKRLAIPITVRQLEAVVRISESLSKMALQPFVTDANVEEALRIFQV